MLVLLTITGASAHRKTKSHVHTVTVTVSSGVLIFDLGFLAAGSAVLVLTFVTAGKFAVISVFFGCPRPFLFLPSIGMTSAEEGVEVVISAGSVEKIKKVNNVLLTCYKYSTIGVDQG